MTFDDFNTITAKQPYIYRRNPHHEQSFVILKQLDDEGRYEPIGDYTVLDQSEDHELSEKKLINLIALMNDSEELVDLREQSQSRLLYFRAPTDEPDKTRIIFYTLGDRGVSKENAVLSLKEGLDDA
ncbi:MAG: hypothetical protein H6867_02795 [Rhodospirillales bacterium]|nr:hypothetical protein [Rhodospirillales bacterium]MCB9997117.1 hypothetical protein [Rhodospirillales bacterium]